ncbi:Retrovirus-related Pol polyprotein from transposon 17.6 [Cucumis melo var. makuwa]|uniref:Retrovirus-related Pol polyprotein from transposon 17.6 n=1 Tax=Cucumis melo var. makuwa TaxID=1194695 RepID=A0A5D3DPV8_CUCMM|nr:Retrovirus-related Pol polyprotein from transposon 17.6 [Cucumis melo var. makuwa]TYK25711.1 Retrovirus-related Pol polyprotein from transposon 17.6 [Cucumis melo var. makuwa]
MFKLIFWILVGLRNVAKLQTEAERKEHLHMVIETLRANKIYAKFSKFKIEAIIRWPRPSTVSEVHNFLGLTGYYRQFVEDFSRIATPLTQLTRKGAPFVWSKACEDSFQNLKQMLITVPVLTVPDGSGSFVIYSDASKKGLGCVLMQQGNANIVADVLSRKVSHSAALITKQAPLYRDLERAEIAVSVGIGKAVGFSISSDGGLLFERCFCVLADKAVKIELLTEAHSSPFFMHPGLPRTLKDFTVIWVVVDRFTKSAHLIPGKSTYTAIFRLPLAWHRLRLCMGNAADPLFVGTRARMPAVQSRQKTYADVRWKDLEFDVRDKVFLKVAPLKGVLRFEKKGKLSSRFVRPFKILERIGTMVYCLALPPSLSAVHDVFHVSILRKYVTDPSHVVDYEPLEIDENLSYAEQPVEILAREVKMLRVTEEFL